MKFTHIILCAMILINFGCDLVDEAIIDVSGKVTDEGQAVAGAIVFYILYNSFSTVFQYGKVR